MGALKGCVVAADRREDGGRQEGKEGERGRGRRGSHGNIGSERIDAAAVENSRCHLSGERAEKPLLSLDCLSRKSAAAGMQTCRSVEGQDRDHGVGHVKRAGCGGSSGDQVSNIQDAWVPRPQPLIQCVPNIGNGPARAMLKNSTPPRRPPALKIPIEVERAECVPLCKMSRNEFTIKVDHVRAVPVSSFQLGRAENGDRQ